MDDVIKVAEIHLDKAAAFTELNQYSEAIPHFKSSIKVLIDALRRTEESKVQTTGCEACKNQVAANGEPESEVDSANRVEKLVKDCILTPIPPVQFSDIVGFEKQIEDIKLAITLPLENPDFFNLGVKPNSTFLLYGPPGIGKTRFANSVATFACSKANYTFFVASASCLSCKWLGESEKALSLLFATCEAQEHSILFFDKVHEVEELIGTTDLKQSETNTRLKNIFLRSLDGITGGLNRTILIAATNKPWLIDSAALSRFQKKYYVSLPTFEERMKIIDFETKNLPKSMTDADLKLLAKKTAGYSGRDLKHMVMEGWLICLSTTNMINGKNPSLNMVNMSAALASMMPNVSEHEQLKMERFRSDMLLHFTETCQAKHKTAKFSLRNFLK